MTMVTSTLKKLLRGESPSLTKGEQQWDYLYSRDAAKALLAAGERGVSGKVYCIGSGQARPLKEYITIMRDRINPDITLGFGEIPYGEKQVMYLCADISELTTDTGFIPETDFETGILETIHWLQKEKKDENN
jgi:nucleoside-diphosphate-sugar epimerase